MHKITPAAQHLKTRQIKLKTKIKYRAEAVRPSSRGNQNFEAARCYKSRKNAVRISLRTHQNFEAATSYKTRIARLDNAKILTAVKTNLTAVKPILTDVKTNLTGESTKYKFHIVRIPPKYKGHKVQTPTTHKGQTLRMQSPRKYKLHKVQVSHVHRVTQRTSAKRKNNKPDSTTPELKYSKDKEVPPQRKKQTPYGPYNLPHMVLCTKKGPDNA